MDDKVEERLAVEAAIDAGPDVGREVPAELVTVSWCLEYKGGPNPDEWALFGRAFDVETARASLEEFRTVRSLEWRAVRHTVSEQVEDW